MAGEERANLEFQQILSRTERKFEIIHVKWIEQKLFEIKFRTQIQRNCDDFNALCDEWVDLFSEITNTVWAKKISNTGPKIRFRKQYQCWTHGGKLVQKELLFDARKCKGTLDMKVLTDNPQTRRKNKHIKLGLNVVVKINFTHLHVVDTQNPFAFFVHNCEPLAEAPRPNIQSNEKLPKLVADMVLKGLNASPKVLNPNISNDTKILQKLISNELEEKSTSIVQPVEQKLEIAQHLIQNHLQVQNMEQMQLNQTLPVQNIDTIKLQIQPQLQQLTQVVVNTPQLDMSEPLLMCQPTLMFDPSQIIPVSAHALPHHFVQVHSHNIHNQQGQYL